MSEISMNSNNLYAVQRRPVQTMPEAAKASFKGAPEPKEKEGWSTTAKVGAAVAVLGAAGLICYLTCGRGLPKDVAQAIKNALEGAQGLSNKSKESLQEIIKNLDSAISKAEGAKVAEDNADLKKMKETLAEAKKQLDNIYNEEKAAAKAAKEQAPKAAEEQAAKATEEQVAKATEEQAPKAAQRTVAIKNAVNAANKAIDDCNTQLCSKGYGENVVSKIDDVLAKLTPEDADYKYWTDKKDIYVERIRQVKDLGERAKKMECIRYNEQTYEQDMRNIDAMIEELDKFGLSSDVKSLQEVKDWMSKTDQRSKQFGRMIATLDRVIEGNVSGSGAAEKTVSEAVPEVANAAEKVAGKGSEPFIEAEKTAENALEQVQTPKPEPGSVQQNTGKIEGSRKGKVSKQARRKLEAAEKAEAERIANEKAAEEAKQQAVERLRKSALGVMENQPDFESLSKNRLEKEMDKIESKLKEFQSLNVGAEDGTVKGLKCRKEVIQAHLNKATAEAKQKNITYQNSVTQMKNESNKKTTSGLLRRNPNNVVPGSVNSPIQPSLSHENEALQNILNKCKNIDNLSVSDCEQLRSDIYLQSMNGKNLQSSEVLVEKRINEFNNFISGLNEKGASEAEKVYQIINSPYDSGALEDCKKHLTNLINSCSKKASKNNFSNEEQYVSGMKVLKDLLAQVEQQLNKSI